MPRLLMRLRLPRPLFASRAPLGVFVLSLATCVAVLAPLDHALRSRVVSSLSDPLLVAFLAAYLTTTCAAIALLALWARRPRRHPSDRQPAHHASR